VSSAVVSIKPGETNTLFLDGHEVEVKIPVHGAGSIGMLIGDPCIRYDPTWCKYGERFQVKETLYKVLNAMAENDELDYWMMFGDLFYDQSGSITQEFFEGLSVNASSSVLGITLGNHDYWIGGSPGGASTRDSFGNGHMQWYAQDTVASKSDESKLFDFSANPDRHQIVDISNSFWYYTMGNVAFIGFSNSYDWEVTEPYFQEACQWVNDTNPALVVIIGHWNSGGLGAPSGMGTESVFPRVQRLPGCDSVGSRLKYVEGHQHCNKVTADNTGFMFGAFGFEDGASCAGAFGLPILDTRNGVARIYYFELGVNGQRTPDYDNIINCVSTRGYSACTKYAQLWMEENLTATSSASNHLPAIHGSSGVLRR